MKKLFIPNYVPFGCVVISCLLLMFGNDAKALAKAGASIHSYNEKIGQPIVIQSKHNASMINSTNKNQKYTFRYYLESDGHYIDKTCEVTLKPGQKYHHESILCLNYTSTKLGHYEINSYTSIIGDFGDHDSVNARAPLSVHP